MSSKRHFTIILEKDIQSGALSSTNGLYISSTPISAARKAVSKLCSDNKNKKVEFSVQETTQGSKNKVYGPYIGYMKKIKGETIHYNPIVKLIKQVSKMKGGEIIAKGSEGIIYRPNINRENENLVSKLVKTDKSRIEFEELLNKIDPTGKYHVKMVYAREINFFNYILKPSIRNLTKENKETYEPNYIITYQYGGISLRDFLDGEYKIHMTKDFCKNMLNGIVNIFEGLYLFYTNGTNHADLHAGNIVFLIENPAIMRLIDIDYQIFIKIKKRKNYTSEIKIIFKDDLQNLNIIVQELLDKFKEVFKHDQEFIETLTNFLNIHEFNIEKILMV